MSSVNTSSWEAPPSLLDHSELSSQLDTSTPPSSSSDDEDELIFSPSPSPPPLPPHLTERQQLSYLLRHTQPSSKPHPTPAPPSLRPPSHSAAAKPSLMSHDKKRKASSSFSPSSPPAPFSLHRLPSSSPSPLPLPTSFPLWSPPRQSLFLSSLPSSPHLYLYHHPTPGVRHRRTAWTGVELRWLRHLVSCHGGGLGGGGGEGGEGGGWGLLALDVPGRSGKDCEEEWRRRVERGEWEEGEKGAGDDFDYAAWYEEVRKNPQLVWGTPEEGAQVEAEKTGGKQAPPTPTQERKGVGVLGKKRVHAMEEEAGCAVMVEKQAKEEVVQHPRPQPLAESTTKPLSKLAEEAADGDSPAPPVQAEVALTVEAVKSQQPKTPSSAVEASPATQAAALLRKKRVKHDAPPRPPPSTPIPPPSLLPLAPTQPPASIPVASPTAAPPTPLSQPAPPTPAARAPSPRTTRRATLQPSVSSPTSSPPSTAPLWIPTPPVLPVPPSVASSTPLAFACSLPSCLSSASPREVAVLRCRVRLEVALARLVGWREGEVRRAEGWRESAVMRGLAVLGVEYYGKGREVGRGVEEGREGREKRVKHVLQAAAQMEVDLRRQFDIDRRGIEAEWASVLA